MDGAQFSDGDTRMERVPLKPPQPRVIALVSAKGGTGKSTIAGIVGEG
jgi:Mrp family chromosome partitioning ATPase